MALNNPYQKYQQNSIMSAPPEELTLMLYNGGVRFIRLGIQDIQAGDTKKSHQSLVRAQEIYKHLQDTLNMEIDISRELYRLYEYIIGQLVSANIKKDASILQEVLNLAEKLRDTWKEAMDKSKGTVKEVDK